MMTLPRLVSLTSREAQKMVDMAATSTELILAVKYAAIARRFSISADLRVVGRGCFAHNVFNEAAHDYAHYKDGLCWAPGFRMSRLRACAPALGRTSQGVIKELKKCT